MKYTPQETIDKIDEVLNSTVYNDESLEYGLSSYDWDWLETAKSTLEKQIPKKVILGYDEQDYVRCPQCKSEIAAMDDDCLLYHCPVCGEKDAILQGDNYCFNCGQALDWRDTE